MGADICSYSCCYHSVITKSEFVPKMFRVILIIVSVFCSVHSKTHYLEVSAQLDHSCSERDQKDVNHCLREMRYDIIEYGNDDEDTLCCIFAKYRDCVPPMACQGDFRNPQVTVKTSIMKRELDASRCRDWDYPSFKCFFYLYQTALIALMSVLFLIIGVGIVVIVMRDCSKKLPDDEQPMIYSNKPRLVVSNIPKY